MRNRTAAVGRILTALLGLGLLVGGGSILLWRIHVHAARRLYAHADRHWYLTAAEQSWWSWALAGLMVFATLAGVILLAANLRPNRLGAIEFRTQAAEPTTLGSSSLNAGALTNAVAASLVKHSTVRSASGRAVLDRGLRTLRITLTAEPDVSLEHLRRLAADAVADIAAATDETDVAAQFFVHFTPVGSER